VHAFEHLRTHTYTRTLTNKQNTQHLGVVTTLTRLMAVRGYEDQAADSLRYFYAADLLMRAPTGALVAKTGEFQTMLGVFVVGAGLCVGIAYAEDYRSLVLLSGALGAVSSAATVAFNAVAPV
jgi:hypothetical protein